MNGECLHTGPDCPAYEPRTVLWALGIDTPSPARQPTAIQRRIEAAWRLAPLPGRLSTDGLRGRGDLAAA